MVASVISGDTHPIRLLCIAKWESCFLQDFRERKRIFVLEGKSTIMIGREASITGRKAKGEDE